MLLQWLKGGRLWLPITVCLRGASHVGQVCEQLLPRIYRVGFRLRDINCARTAHFSFGDPAPSSGQHDSHPKDRQFVQVHVPPKSEELQTQVPKGQQLGRRMQDRLQRYLLGLRKEMLRHVQHEHHGIR